MGCRASTFIVVQISLLLLLIVVVVVVVFTPWEFFTSANADGLSVKFDGFFVWFLCLMAYQPL